MDYRNLKFTTIDDFKNLRPKKDFFVGLDSDGTVFDSMELKHKDCFIGSLIRNFELAPIAHEVHFVWNYVNLFSQTRGQNRFKALINTFKCLNKIKKVQNFGILFPDLHFLNEWIIKSKSLSNESLLGMSQTIKFEDKKALETIIKWSEEVNEAVKSTVFNLPPMKGAIEAIKIMNPFVDIAVISNTPLEALYRDWAENKILSKVIIVGGQETGTKKEMLKCIINKKYDQDKILIIGDSPGDLTAAKSIKAQFFPIIPKKEELSWELFNQSYFKYFFEKKYFGNQERDQINKFNLALNSKPVW